jgi:hypothetical protein
MEQRVHHRVDRLLVCVRVRYLHDREVAMNYLFIMFIWVGSVHGGPAVITGFTDLRTCEDARAYVEQEYTALRPATIVDHSVKTRCVQLAR